MTGDAAAATDDLLRRSSLAGSAPCRRACLVRADVRGDELSFVEELHGVPRGRGIELLAGQPPWPGSSTVLSDLVDVRAHRVGRPCGQFERVARQRLSARASTAAKTTAGGAVPRPADRCPAISRHHTTAAACICGRLVNHCYQKTRMSFGKRFLILAAICAVVSYVVTVAWHTFVSDAEGWSYLLADLLASVFNGATGGLIFALLLGRDWSGRQRGGGPA